MATAAVSPIKSTLEAIGGDFVRGMGEFLTRDDAAKGYVRTTEWLLKKTPIGNLFFDHLNGYEQFARSAAQKAFDAKITAGIHPETASREAAREGFNLARKTYLGKNDEALIAFIHSAAKQHGPIYGNAVADAMTVYFGETGAYAKKNFRSARVKSLGPGATGKGVSLRDVGINPGSNYQAPKEWEQQLRRAMSWMLTPLIAIPHIGQIANVLLDNSFADFAKGMSEYFSKATAPQFKNDLIRSGALFDELRYDVIANAQGGGLARSLFHHPGFGFVRRVEIGMAAATGKHAALSAFDKFSTQGDKWSEFTLKKLGLNPQTLLQQGGLSKDDIFKAMYNEANRTIFIRSALETPWKWEENFVARMLSQYRHFAYRQTKFLGSAFKDAYKNGGVSEITKTALKLATIFPVMGEIVHSIENAAEFKNPTDRTKDKKFLDNEYADAMAHAAGFGMFYSMMRASMYNGGRGFLEGPLLSTAEDLTIGVISRLAKGNYRSAAKTLVRKASWPGRIAADHIDTQADKVGKRHTRHQ